MTPGACRPLGIPHYVLDYESRFRREVMADFAASYQAGETPIPCVRCNQRVKFRDLLENARELGAVALATGHYARIEEGAAGGSCTRPPMAIATRAISSSPPPPPSSIS
jgi:Predicted tRNA(5-methylaminomethyl-2-thiouridylate) methyltransferase, contains the PP-loop ATPase domain